MSYENATTEEIVAMVVETDAEIKQRDVFGLSAKELSANLPQVFTRSGTIRKDTRHSLRGLEETIKSIKMGERCRNEYLAAEHPRISIDLPCGELHLSDDMCAHIFLNDLFVALATRGWFIRSV